MRVFCKCIRDKKIIFIWFHFKYRQWSDKKKFIFGLKTYKKLEFGICLLQQQKSKALKEDASERERRSVK